MTRHNPVNYKGSSLSDKYFHIHVYMPLEWRRKVDEYMAKHGYYSYSEMVRDLIRREIIEKSDE